jgi:hypothetical protein
MTQIALFSTCINNCKTVENITWNVYQGSNNSSSNTTQWTLFNQMSSYQDIWFFGKCIGLLYITNELFFRYKYNKFHGNKHVISR